MEEKFSHFCIPKVLFHHSWCVCPQVSTKCLKNINMEFSTKCCNLCERYCNYVQWPWPCMWRAGRAGRHTHPLRSLTCSLVDAASCSSCLLRSSSSSACCCLSAASLVHVRENHMSVCLQYKGKALLFIKSLSGIFHPNKLGKNQPMGRR